MVELEPVNITKNGSEMRDEQKEQRLLERSDQRKSPATIKKKVAERTRCKSVWFPTETIVEKNKLVTTKGLEFEFRVKTQ